jgi:hypothetical protein
LKFAHKIPQQRQLQIQLKTFDLHSNKCRSEEFGYNSNQNFDTELYSGQTTVRMRKKERKR